MKEEHVKVLEAIQELCMESDNESVIMNPEGYTDKALDLAQTISKIYMLAHSHAGHCGNTHEDWKLKV